MNRARPRLTRRRGDKRDLALRPLLAPYLRRERKHIVTMSVASVLGGFAEAGVLLMIARVAFALTADKNDVDLTNPVTGSTHVSIGSALVLTAFLIGVRVALQWANTVAAARASADILVVTRRRLMDGLLHASWPVQADQREGRAQELVSSYAAGASGALGAVSGLITSAFSLAAMLAAALFVSPVASVGAAAAALLIGMMLRPLRAAVRRRYTRKADANLALATGVTELTAALQEARIFGVTDEIGERVEALSARASRLELESSYAAGVVPVLYLGAAMMLIVGALAIVEASGATGIGSLGAVVLIMVRSLSYAQGVQSGIQGLHGAAPYLETLHDEIELYQRERVPPAGGPVQHIGSIEFEDVSFHYEPSRPVLTGVTFRVEPGEIIGVVGPSGAGKSTLVQLLLRLRDPVTGAMLSDGTDVRSLAIGDWYRHITFVPQEARLFAGTVAENIAFFRDVDMDQVQRAARRAHLHDEIVAWPLGYDTPVGQRGGQISGGQRQRLCIARALVGDPDVVVLDEPTSALDVRSESLMRETMRDLAPSKTVFIVAHRLSTLTICDRIMVFLDGKLQAFGDPDHLEATSEFYRDALRLSGLR